MRFIYRVVDVFFEQNDDLLKRLIVLRGRLFPAEEDMEQFVIRKLLDMPFFCLCLTVLFSPVLVLLYIGYLVLSQLDSPLNILHILIGFGLFPLYLKIYKSSGLRRKLTKEKT